MSSFADLLFSWEEGWQESMRPSRSADEILSGDLSYSSQTLSSLLSSISPATLERMAHRAKAIRVAHHGNAIKLFTPFYLSNFCSNGCLYCAFKRTNDIARHQLDFDSLESEAVALAGSGIRHLLVLTGEDMKKVPVSYISESLKLLSNHFASLSMEVYPMDEGDYRSLVDDASLDGLTLYQETYNREVYAHYHPTGKKRDFLWRLEGVERACRAGVRSVTVGALLGLDDPLRELGALALHLDYLSKRYPDVELSVSFPRLRPIKNSDFTYDYDVDDRFYAQIVLAFRILFPHVGITLSTRESESMRNGLIPLGVTKISAGVSTSVGGIATDQKGDEQFKIADERSLDEMCRWLTESGFQPVLHDWSSKLIRS